MAGIILRSNGTGAYGGGTYDIIGPTGTSLGYATVAAKVGDTVELFGVGFGPTTPPVPAGQIFSGSAVTTNPVQLTIGGKPVTTLGGGEVRPGFTRSMRRSRRDWGQAISRWWRQWAARRRSRVW